MNQIVFSNIIDSALIVAVISVWAYIVAFLHAFAYCSTFKIPVDFASLDKKDIVFPVIGVTFYMILFYGLLRIIGFKFLDSSSGKVGIILFGILVAYFIGFYRAAKMRVFMVLQKNPKLIIWYKSGEKLFCEKYNEEQKKLTGEFLLIEITDDLVIKREQLGDIKLTRGWY